MKRIVSVILMGILALSLCGCGDTYKKYGEFYSLQEAYEQGYISKEDLTSIAYYKNGGRKYNEEIMAEDYVPLPKMPETLSENTERKIKETLAYEARHSQPYLIEDATPEQASIRQYYGTYNGYVAVMVQEIGVKDSEAERIIKIDKVTFFYGSGNSITLWKENNK